MASHAPSKAGEFNRKSGTGKHDGVVSELAAFFEVKLGHEEQMRAAVQRFTHFLRNTPIEDTMETGLRDTRHVIFDGGKRLLWVTTFESDWDTYIEEALIVLGIDRFLDWMQHTTLEEAVTAWMRDCGGAEKFRQSWGGPRSADVEKFMRMSSGGLKEIIKSAQTPAACYFNPVSYATHPQIRKALRVERALQQVLDDPEAAKPLHHPALKALLAEAAA